MIKVTLFAVIMALIIFSDPLILNAQSESRKFEIGAQFSTLGINDPNGLGPRREEGFGGRLTFDLNRHLALETEIDFFPRNFKGVITDFSGGRITQGLLGVKAGIRKERFGFFGKARPGFISSGGAARAKFPNGDGPNPRNPFGFEFFRATQAALDVGGVVELYPSRRITVRFDLGDTIIRYPNVEFIQFPAGVPIKETVYSNKLQFSAGFGFRF